MTKPHQVRGVRTSVEFVVESDGTAIHTGRAYVYSITFQDKFKLCSYASNLVGFRHSPRLTLAAHTYCFVAVNSACVPCNLSSTTTFIVFPSADTVIRATLITFPSRLSVSSIVLAPVFFTETLVVPGSPLYGASVPSNFAV